MAMIIPPMDTPQFTAAIDLGVRKHWVDEYNAAAPTLEKVLKVMDQKDYNELHQNYAGTGFFSQITEGDLYPQDGMIQAYNTTYNSEKYGEALSITHELMFWDKSGLAKAKEITSAHAKSAAATVERLGALSFIRGFNTSYTSLSTAKPLFSTSIPRADGGTAYSNASSTGLTLTFDNLSTGVRYLREQLDDRGKPIRMAPAILLVPPALELKALEMTKSITRSDTADRADNVYRMKEYSGGSIRVIVWDYLAASNGGSDTAWYLLSDEHRINFLWGERPKLAELDKSIGFLNDTYVWKTRLQCSRGWDDHRGVWASKGDGLAYSS
jgi:hypothetical protein